MTAKEELQQSKKNIENEYDRQIRERKEELKPDVEEFVQALESYFKETKTTRNKFDYKVKESSGFGIFGQLFSEDHISISLFASPLQVAYKKLFDKWFFKENLLIGVLAERLKEDSIIYQDCEAGLIGNLRTVSFEIK